MIAVVALTAPAPAGAEGELTLTLLDRFETGTFDEGGSEIPTFDPKSQRFFVTNGAESAVDVLELQDGKLVRVAQIPVPAVTSVAVSPKGGLLAVPAADETDPGQVRTYNTKNLELRRTSTVGALPDMLTFTPDSKDILVANEGEPSGYETGDVDPEGSVSIVDAANGKVRTADFRAFNDRAVELRDAGVRIFGPGASVAQDLEPEYIAITGDGSTAYVALRENNALAVLDVRSATITEVLPLGLKDHSLAGNELDASDKDDVIDIRNWPVKGMYMPDPTVFPNRDELQQKENLGRLKFAAATSPTNADGEFTELHSFGGRSFSIRDTSGALVFDSGSDFEDITAERIPAGFNSTNDKNGSFDSRSDDKGPEPEGIEIGVVDGRTYAFIGLERVGGVMIYDITDPADVTFVDYVNTRDFSGNAKTGTAGDLAPEGLTFIPAADSPTGEPLLVVAYEVSGTTSLYTIG